jgi:hypothetical protein
LLEDRCVPTGTLVGVPFTSFNPQPTEGSAFTGQIATVFDTGPLSPVLPITINWGDGTATDTTTGLATLISGAAGAFAFSISGTHTYAEESGSTTPPFNFMVTVTVRDTANGIAPITINSQTSVLDANLSQGNPVTATPSQIFTGVGGTNTSTTAGTANAALTNFETAIGGVKNTAAAPQNGGFRTITWDGVKTDGTDAVAGANSTVVITPNTVGIPLNRFEGSGVYFGAVYAVSSDKFVGANPSVGTAPALFPAFSSPSTFAMFNDNGIDFKFVAPAPTNSTIVAAASKGFGAIFINVEQANTTSIQYFNGNNLLATEFAPVGGTGQPVFVGALFNSPVVTRVLLTLGNNVLFKFDGTTLTSGGADSRTTTGTNLVVTDDWAFAEPVPTLNGLPVVTGAQGTTNAAVLPVTAAATVPFTGVVGTFNDQDPNGNAKDFTATINWGDGHSTNATITRNAQGGFDVSGTNTYAHEGLFPINIDVADFGGGNGIAGSIPTVSINNTLKVVAPPFNFDKLGAYRPSNGSWSLDSNGGRIFNPATSQTFLHFSPPNVTGVAGDWLGIGRSQIGDFSNGTWHLDLAGTGAAPGANETFQFGQAGDQPVVGNWDGDKSGRSELGVFRTAPDGITGEFILDIANHKAIDSSNLVFTFGLATDHVIVGDWTGNGTTKVGVFRDAKNFNPAAAGDIVFSINENGDHQTFTNFIFGLITDKVVIGDWTGDHIAKVGVYRDGGIDHNAPGVALFTLDSGARMFNAQSQVFLFGLISDQFVSGNWPATPPLLPAQFAAEGVGPGGVPPLTDAELAPVLDQALADWAARGADTSLLASVPVHIGTLGGGLVGWTDASGITLDATAAGWGWYVDPTPGQDAVFTLLGPDGLHAAPDSPAAGKMDLLTVVEHELGHELGLDDLDPAAHPADLMAATLATGVRRQ